MKFARAVNIEAIINSSFRIYLLIHLNIEKGPIRIMEGLTSYLLGNAYTECSKLDVALACYNNYYEISKRSKNLENFGRASEAVAKCYEK